MTRPPTLPHPRTTSPVPQPLDVHALCNAAARQGYRLSVDPISGRWVVLRERNGSPVAAGLSVVEVAILLDVEVIDPGADS